MTRPVVAVLDRMPPSSREVISSVFGGRFDVVFVEEDSPRAKAEAATGATVLLTMWGSVDAATIAAAPRCRLVQKLGVGVDRIDAAEAARRGVAVLRAAGVNAEAVAELTVLLMLAVGRHLAVAMAASATGQVRKEALRAQSVMLLGRRVGLLGVGHIGLAVARRLAGFGVGLAYHDVRRLAPGTERELALEYLPLAELVSSVDVLSLHLPLTPETEGIISRDLLTTVRPGLIVVNTARGSLVDETALVEAIGDGRVLGAGLDVTPHEPLPPDSPLHGLDRVILTPHIGGAVADNFPRVIRHAYRNTVAILDGGTVADADVVVRPGTGPDAGSAGSTTGSAAGQGAVGHP